MLRARLIQAQIARTRQALGRVLAEVLSTASTAGLRRELLEKANELEEQAEAAEAELRRIRNGD